MWKPRLAQTLKATNLGGTVSFSLCFMHHGRELLQSSKVSRFFSVLALILLCEMQRDTRFLTTSTMTKGLSLQAIGENYGILPFGERISTSITSWIQVENNRCHRYTVGDILRYTVALYAISSHGQRTTSESKSTSYSWKFLGRKRKQKHFRMSRI
jgi:hypothetical protein